MNEINLATATGELQAEGKGAAVIALGTMRIGALSVALLSSAISLGVAVFAGTQRGGSAIEQFWSVATSIVAVLCVHLVPMLCRFVSRGGRLALVILWLLATTVVLRGQVDVLAFANQHAADERAQTVAAVAVSAVTTEQAGRSLTVIAQDIAKVTIDLAHVESRRCTGECRTLGIRKAELSAQLGALNAEFDEAKRRATQEEWNRDQNSHAEQLRESHRSDPATSMVASWLGTTEARLNTLLDLACVVVLEGTACFAWYLAGPGAITPRRKSVASDESASVSRCVAVVQRPEATTDSRAEQSDGRAMIASDRAPVDNDAHCASCFTEDDLQVAKIREAVLAGHLKRNLKSIREFLQCGQRKATLLNRLYIERFGEAPKVDGAG
jgi:hypothetical protein